MRALRFVTVGIAVAAIFLCWCNSVHAGPSLWPSNKGEICFNNTSNGRFVRLGVMRTVGNNYIVHGFVTEGVGNPYSLFNGNAIVDGDKILMHVSSSGYQGSVEKTNTGYVPHVTEIYGSIGRVELSASDLTGWVLSFGLHCQGNVPNNNCDFDSAVIQNLEPTPCP
jgi:hypothetical protein